jgi:NAD(P)-dependent dehydrogenase (short-subunit alcohol dehydrogenase family)
MLLQGNVAIVAGVGPGLGRSIALALAEQGAQVVLAARREATLAAVADEIAGLGGPPTLSVVTDITDAVACMRLVDATVERFGRIDALVNNAMSAARYGRADTLSVEDWRVAMETNFFGALQLIQAAIPHMQAQRRGSIVNINTMGTELVRPHGSPYSSSKGALATLTKSLAVDLGGFGIRVNGVLPGYIWAPPLEEFFEAAARVTNRSADDVRIEVADQCALRRIPDADEVARVVVFFASDMSSSVTGQNLLANGGLRITVPGMVEGAQPIG